MDEGVRRSTTAAGLAKLRPVFSLRGTTTAGNASQVSDGAAVTLLMARERADALGLKPLGVLRGFTVVGVAPEIMGIGPAKAIPAACEKAGIDVSDVSLFEINEAFACVAMAAIHDLNLDHSKVNVNGGACALGHPIGASGARILVTLVHALKNRGGKTGIASLCIGGGEAVAIAIEAL